VNRQQIWARKAIRKKDGLVVSLKISGALVKGVKGEAKGATIGIKGL